MKIKHAIKTLSALREYAVDKGVRAAFFLHQEDSHLVRLANSGVSLNTSEALSRVYITAYGVNKTASAFALCDLMDEATLFAAVDQAQNMLADASALSFQPTFPQIKESSRSTTGYDQALAELSNEDILAYIHEATEDLLSEDVKLSGSFSVGSTLTLSMSTATEHSVAWLASDAQITLVLSSQKDKWEINAEQSAYQVSDLNASKMRERLLFLKDKYETCPAVQLPIAPYQVVFGAAATAEYLSFLSYLGTDGGNLMRDNSINRLEDIGRMMLSDQVSLLEDPDCLSAFAIPVDSHGRARGQTACYDKGVFKGFLWEQQDADEYGQTATGHDLAHSSFCLLPGAMPVNELSELQELAKAGDLLYVPYLHYTGLVNATEGLVTGTSRFGALLFKQDGSIKVPFNVRFTEKLSDLFGGKLCWLSNQTEAYNTSSTYDARNPEAYLVPKMMCCKNVKVEISNKSY